MVSLDVKNGEVEVSLLLEELVEAGNDGVVRVGSMDPVTDFGC